MADRLIKMDLLASLKDLIKDLKEKRIVPSEFVQSVEEEVNRLGKIGINMEYIINEKFLPEGQAEEWGEEIKPICPVISTVGNISVCLKETCSLWFQGEGGRKEECVLRGVYALPGIFAELKTKG